MICRMCNHDVRFPCNDFEHARKRHCETAPRYIVQELVPIEEEPPEELAA